MAKNKVYVVWSGFNPGIYTSWPECQKRVNGYSGAKYKGFSSLREAEQAFRETPATRVAEFDEKPRGTYLTVDAAFSHKTQILEWRGVLVEDTKQTEVFYSGIHVGGSANVGEFLAIINGIDFLRSRSLDIPLYSDSYNAQLWVRKKAYNTSVKLSSELSNLLTKAYRRLNEGLNESSGNKIIIKDWVTKKWGEIPADFGRK